MVPLQKNSVASAARATATAVTAASVANAAHATAPKPLHIVYPPNRHLSNKVRVFVDWLAELFARDEFILSRGGNCKPTILPAVPLPIPAKADQLSSSSSA